MCGIVGFLDKTQNGKSRLGSAIIQMLTALACRGPDSAGVALYGADHPGHVVLRIKLAGDEADCRPEQLGEKVERIVDRAGGSAGTRVAATCGGCLRLVAEEPADAKAMESAIEQAAEDIEILSMGRKLEIAKQVGSPQNLDRTFGISQFAGTHGLGHSRLSTESRVDLSHSQPFWAHGVLDLAIVHNGHICNYHKLRRRYEQHGVRFYTENDSEIIGVYLAEQRAHGLTLEESMQKSLVDFDGSFSYLAATEDALGFCKDSFAFKPLLSAETEAFVAVATEEIAIRAAFPGDYQVREAQAGEVRIWQR